MSLEMKQSFLTVTEGRAEWSAFTGHVRVHGRKSYLCNVYFHSPEAAQTGREHATPELSTSKIVNFWTLLGIPKALFGRKNLCLRCSK